MAMEAFLINPPKRLSKRKRNPLAEEALVLGGLNPGRKKKNVKSGYLKNKPKRKKGVVIDMAKKRKARKRNPGTALALNRRRSVRRSNPGSRLAKRNAPRRRRYYRNEPRRKRSRRGRYRRNAPAMFGRGGAISLQRPQTIIMPIITGVIAKMTVDRLPAMMKLQPGNTTIMAQLAIGIGGGIMLTPVLGATGATIWLAVAGATAVTNWLNATMLKALSDDEEIVYLPNEGVGAYPDEGMYSGLSAYPEEV